MSRVPNASLLLPLFSLRSDRDLWTSYAAGTHTLLTYVSWIVRKTGVLAGALHLETTRLTLIVTVTPHAIKVPDQCYQGNTVV